MRGLHWAKWTLVVLLWVVFIGASFVLMESSDYGAGDFLKYYHAAKDYLPARMPYQRDLINPGDTLPYPPLLPQLMMPFAKTLDAQTAARLWYTTNVVALVAALAALAGRLPAKQRFTFWLLGVFFVPLFEALRIGQVNPLLLALIVFAWVSAKANHPRLAGFLLAIAAWIKLYPALILVYFLWKRNWRAVQGGLIGGIGLALFQIAVSGTGVFVEFINYLTLHVAHAEIELMWKNNSIFGFATKLFQASDKVIPLAENPTLLLLTRISLTGLALGALFILTAQRKPQRESLRNDARFDLEYALAVLTMLLVSPWMYADSIAPVLITLFILWQEGRTRRTTLSVLIVGALIVANYLLIWQPGTAYSALLLSVGFYALALLWLVNVTLLMQSRNVGTDPIATTRHPA